MLYHSPLQTFDRIKINRSDITKQRGSAFFLCIQIETSLMSHAIKIQLHRQTGGQVASLYSKLWYIKRIFLFSARLAKQTTKIPRTPFATFRAEINQKHLINPSYTIFLFLLHWHFPIFWLIKKDMHSCISKLHIFNWMINLQVFIPPPPFILIILQQRIFIIWCCQMKHTGLIKTHFQWLMIRRRPLMHEHGLINTCEPRIISTWGGVITPVYSELSLWNN